MNCWEFWGCGRESSGENVDEQGVCPAATETRLDGVHGGKNASRACWAISETLCTKRIGGPEASRTNCLLCSFYNHVLDEEIHGEKGGGITFTSQLLAKLEAPETKSISDGTNTSTESMSA